MTRIKASTQSRLKIQIITLTGIISKPQDISFIIQQSTALDKPLHLCLAEELCSIGDTTENIQELK